MRLLTFAVLAAGVAVGACNRADVTAAASTSPEAAASSDANAGSAPAVGTAGRTEAAEMREVTIPAGTRLPIILDTSIGSETSHVEQSVSAHVSRPVVIGGRTVIAEGSRVSGVVTDAKRSGKVKGRAHVAVRFDTLTPRGDNERYRIAAGAIGRTAQATKKKDAMEIGAPAAGGAIVGGILGGKKGALIGTAAGGGAGTAVVLSTRGKEVHLPKGSALTIRLTEPLTIKLRG